MVSPRRGVRYELLILQFHVGAHANMSWVMDGDVGSYSLRQVYYMLESAAHYQHILEQSWFHRFPNCYYDLSNTVCQARFILAE